MIPLMLLRNLNRTRSEQKAMLFKGVDACIDSRLKEIRDMYANASKNGSGGGGAQYASGSDSLPSSGTKTIPCGFEPQVIILKFLPESGKYRDTVVYSKKQNEVPTIYLGRITYNPSGGMHGQDMSTVSNLHFNNFSVTNGGFIVGTTINSGYSSSFDWEVYG